MKPHLHVEIDRFDERIFVRFYFRRLSAGVLMFHPQEWDAFLGALRQTFELEIDTVDHNQVEQG